MPINIKEVISTNTEITLFFKREADNNQDIKFNETPIQ